jgi:F-box interacting protein
MDTCNGLLLCARLKRETSAAGKDEVRYVVCNPATEKWIELPPQPQDWENRFHSVARLAFDPAVSSHFHVSEFIQSSPGYVTGVDIFSSQTGAWSRKDSVLVEEITLLNGTMSVFFGGMLHLVGELNPSMHQEYALLVVDMEGKAWKTIHLPIGSGYGTIELSQGYLYFAGTTLAQDNNSIRKNDVLATNITLWCLENYDSKEWVLKRSASIPEPLGTTEVEWKVFAIHPDCDTVLLVPIRGDRLASYDLQHQKFVDILNLEQANLWIYLPYVPLFSEMQIGSSFTFKPPLCLL